MKNLKSIFLMTLCISLVFLTSCSKDDDSDSGSASGEITGTWEMKSYDYEGMSTTETNGQTYDNEFEGTGRDIDAEVDFNADGTYTSRGSYTIDLVIDFAGQTFTIPTTIDNFAGSGTYVRNGNEITVTDQMGETSTMTITKLDGDDLDIDFDFSDTSTQNGATSTFDVQGEYTFERK